MRVRDVMTRNVKSVAPEDAIQTAARKMRDLDIGPLPVCDHDHLAGLVTDRDIPIRATADGKDPTRSTVREVMTPDVVYCFEDQDVKDAADALAAHQIRRLIVLNVDEALAGIVSMADLAVDAGRAARPAERLRQVCEPAEPRR
jgi:CBS domain-containing protein